MKYLQKLAGGTDTTLALHALLRQPELWSGNIITLREEVQGEYVNWFALDLLPQLRQFIFGVMARVEGESLGVVKLVQVAPGEQWAASKHVEDFYFVTISVLPGVSVQTEGEGVMLLAGDVWWVGGPPQFINNSSDAFIYLEMHIRPSSPATYVPEPKL